MPARQVFNTMSDKLVNRLSAYKDGVGKKVIEYSDGSEIHVEKTGDGARSASGREVLKEVRTIVKVKSPSANFGQTHWTDPDQYSRIFGHE